MELGRVLTEELGLHDSHDTLGEWMAHHISELITNVETAEGNEKPAAEDRCREAILALWKHHRFFPREHRPLENIEPLLATIQALAPENQSYFYKSEVQSQIEESKLSDRAKEFLDLSLEIDYSARLLIEMCLKIAANEIFEDKCDLIELAGLIGMDSQPINILRILTDRQEKSIEEKKSEAIRDSIKILKDRRERLIEIITKSELLVQYIDNILEEYITK